jgi:hypothetical protein
MTENRCQEINPLNLRACPELSRRGARSRVAKHEYHEWANYTKGWKIKSAALF